MTKFKYKSRDEYNALVTGIEEKNDIDEVIEALEKKQLLPITITEIKDREANSVSQEGMEPPLLKNQIQIESRATYEFTLSLGSLLTTGIPLLDSLEQASLGHSRSFRNKINTVISALTRGSGVAAAFRQGGKQFSNFFITCLERGESNSQLLESIQALAPYIDSTRSRHIQWRRQVIWPATLGLSGSVSALLSLIPGAFPGMALSALAVLSLSFFLMGKWPPASLRVRNALCRIPFFDKLFEVEAWLLFSSQLHQLLISGTRLETAAMLVGDNIRHLPVLKKCLRLRAQIAEGYSLLQALESVQRPPYILTKSLSLASDPAEVREKINFAANYYAGLFIQWSKSLSAWCLAIMIFSLLLWIARGFVHILFSS